MIALSEVLTTVRRTEWTPLISGVINPETRIALQMAGAPPPASATPVGSVDAVALVDTHNPEQLADWIDPALVTDVVDHHRDGSRSDFPNAEFQVRPVGATATIILAFVKANRIPLSDASLHLIGAAIVSNTLGFDAPSTTDEDREAAKSLRARGYLWPEIERQMKEGRAAFVEGNTTDVISRDVKAFDIHGDTVVISQVEAPSASEIAERDDVIRALDELAAKHDAAAAILNLVCLSTRTSTLVARQGPHRDSLAIELTLEFVGNKATVDRILLRKTDLVPAMMTTRLSG